MVVVGMVLLLLLLLLLLSSFVPSPPRARAGGRRASPSTPSECWVCVFLRVWAFYWWPRLWSRCR